MTKADHFLRKKYLRVIVLIFQRINCLQSSSHIVKTLKNIYRLFQTLKIIANLIPQAISRHITSSLIQPTDNNEVEVKEGTYQHLYNLHC